MMNTSVIKKIFKKTVPLLPGYHSACLVLQRHRPKSWDWIDRIPVKPGVLVKVKSKAGDFYMSRPERCSIAKKYFWTDGLRRPLEDLVALNLFASLARDSDVVLDIGSNSGLFSLVAAKINPDAEIVAFDILPEAYHILSDNLILNGLTERVKIRLVGVGEAGNIFYAPFKNISSEMPSSLSLDSAPLKDDQIPVLIKSLDEICIPDFCGKKVCIKIDVEGTEFDIFANGRETLRSIKPDFVCEVLPIARRWDAYDRILEEHSYEKYLITDEGLRHFDKISPHVRFKDWFFTTRTDFNIPLEGLLE